MEKQNSQTKKEYIIADNDAEGKLAIEMLKRHEIPHTITKLAWGALWSNLETQLQQEIISNPETTYVGVGLNGEPIQENCENLEDDSETSKESSLQLLAMTLGLELNQLEQFAVANNKGYIPEMYKLGQELGLSDEEIRRQIDLINQLEYEAKDIDENLIQMGKEAIKKGYIYDDRLITVDIADFRAMRVVTNELYEMGKYTNMAYNVVFLNSHDEAGRMVVFGAKEGIVRELYDRFLKTQSRKPWIGGNEQAGFFGIQLGETEEKERVYQEILEFLEDKLLGYHRLIEAQDIEETENVAHNLNIHKIGNPEAFFKAIMAAKENNDHSAFLSTYSAQEYVDMKKFVVNAGSAGVAIKPSGDIVSVFKNPNMAQKDDIKQINRELLLTALRNGGNHLDCFDGFLPDLYSRYGFRPICRLKFDDEYAPDGWNFEIDGRPDVVFMAASGDDYETVIEKSTEKAYKKYGEYESVPYIESYDQADELIKAYFDSIKQ